MKAAVVARAKALGFEDCRVTTAEPPASGEWFERWLAAGCHGQMGWLERNAAKRVDPSQVLPGAQSIIVLALSYATGSDAADQPRTTRSASGPCHAQSEHYPRGVIARYARHIDYHDVLADRLAELSRFIDAQAGPGTRSLWYVDTGPILERDLAQRAGLGFVGKHTNLISRTLGNWFLISEILTTARLDPDPPEQNRCGNCTRCISACPTAAIKAPFELDARRCISYLTIELKGSIPVELRPAIGNRIFGCDDCLAACPWNRFAREGAIMRSHSRPDLAAPELLELLKLDDATFKTRFAGTPLLRSKRRGLLRNVCVALGNVGGQEAIPALEEAARDPEPLIAEHARWALEQIRARHPLAGEFLSPSSAAGHL